MSWHVGLIDLPYIAGAVGAQIAVAWWVQLRLQKERLARIEAETKMLEAQTLLVDAGERLGRTMRERDHLAEVLRHCTCASFPAGASAPWPRHYAGKLPRDE